MLTIRCNHVRLAKKLQHQQQHRTLMKGRHIAMIANTSTTTNHCTIPRQKIATILTPCTKYKKTSTQNVAPQCRHKHTHTHMPNHKKTTDGSDTCTPPRLMASKQSTTTTCLLRLNGGESRKMPQPKCHHTHTQKPTTKRTDRTHRILDTHAATQQNN